ncbi:MAG TPA: hypothetical protein VFS09_06820 [Candidatus Eisenbacteria bacterium]|nr:hypothetical protein [Candidatus Eisenbacteria bacterium]
MTTDVLLLVLAGVLALFAGGLTVLFAPGRFPSLLVGGGLALLGIVQIGFARVTLDVPWGGGEIWFRYTLALALPATLLWVLAAVTLGRPRASQVSAPWRLYLLAQAGASSACIAWLVLGPQPAVAPGGGVDLDPPARVLLGLVLLNTVVYVVKFEAAYFSFARRHRRAFRPALFGIVVCAIFYTAMASRGLLSAHASVSHLAYGAGPVALLALLAPVSFIRGRVGDARLAPSHHPVTATTSFLLAAAFLAGTATLLWMTHFMGVSLVRGLWLLATGGSIFALTALVVSNRARRRVERALAPLWHDWGGAYRVAANRAAAPLESCGSLGELFEAIPANAVEIADVDPVTLFVARAGETSIECVASSMDSRPDVRVASRDPLAVELRRARRPIRLHGRVDDLEYVSIYVENREALHACRARFAVPLMGEEGMVGFLLCGARRGGRKRLREAMRLLHFAARRYAALIEKQSSRQRPGRER